LSIPNPLRRATTLAEATPCHQRTRRFSLIAKSLR
jgi:hypothetical protein